MHDFKVELENKTKNIEEIIRRYEPEEAGMQKLIAEAVNYSIEAGGKRLRPMFMLETFRLFSEEEEVVYPFMTAIEMIHTYSLVHDDLPAMDNDMYRRGKKTTHAAFGEDIGILAGDALLNMAFEIMSNTVCESPEPKRAAKAMALIAEKAGMYGMIGGQTIDVLNENNPDITLDTIKVIHKLKTAALIEASMMTGAILAGASDEELSCIEQIAGNIGIAFQIQDDILDIVGDEKTLGKPVFSDEKNNKKTYVTFVGLENAKEEVKKHSEEAIAGLDRICKEHSSDAEFLRELIIQLIYREK